MSKGKIKQIFQEKFEQKNQLENDWQNFLKKELTFLR